MSEAYSPMRPAASTDNNPSARCTGIDDGPFSPKKWDKPCYAPLVVAQLSGPRLTRLITDWVTIDGLDGTERAEALLAKIPKSPVLLSGVSFGGFNLIDPRILQRKFRVPVIVVVGSRPDNRAVKSALVKHFTDWKQRWKVISSLGPPRRVRTNPDEPPIYYEAFGCSDRAAAALLKANSYVSRIPEPIRVAGLLARGLFSTDARARTAYHASRIRAS